MSHFSEFCNNVGAKHSAWCTAFSNSVSVAGLRLACNAPFTLWFSIICILICAINSSCGNLQDKTQLDKDIIMRLIKELNQTSQDPNITKDKIQYIKDLTQKDRGPFCSGFQRMFASPMRQEITPWNVLAIPRLFTHVLGHASWSHLLGNLQVFVVVTPFLEEKYKARWLIIISLISGFTAALYYIIFIGENTIVLGASGIVWQNMLLAVFAGRRLRKGDIPMTLLLAIFVFVYPEIQAYFNPSGRTSHIAHLLGGLVGAVIGFLARNHSYLKDEIGRDANPYAIEVPPPVRELTQSELRDMRSNRFGP